METLVARCNEYLDISAIKRRAAEFKVRRTQSYDLAMNLSNKDLGGLSDSLNFWWNSLS